MAAQAELPLSEAVKRSWEQLKAEAESKTKMRATHILQMMTAVNGDEKSWKALRDQLVEILKR